MSHFFRSKSHSGITNIGFQGGAVDSFTDPTSGHTYDIGVGDFTDYGNVTGFFGRFNIPSKSLHQGTIVTFATLLFGVLEA